MHLSAEAFSHFIERLPVAVACFGVKREFIALNTLCAEMNGVEKENTIGKTLLEIVPDLEPVLRPFFNKVYDQNESVLDKLVEGKTAASDQVRFWLASYQPLELSNAERGLLVTAEEITQQVFLKQSADKNKRLLTDVLDSLYTFVFLLNNEGILLDANKAPLDAANINIFDVKGKNFWDCFWFAKVKGVRSKIMRAVKDVQRGKSVRFDIDINIEKETLTVDFMMEGLKNSDGELTHIIPSAIDISERVRSEFQLKHSQSRFETIMNRTADGLVVFDEHGEIQFFNKRFEAISTLPIQPGKTNIMSFIDDVQVLEQFRAQVREVHTIGIHAALMKASYNAPQVVCLVKPNNTPIKITISPLLDGLNVHYLATMSDVSALYDANRTLEKILKEKMVLLNEVHHRVKNNLQVMSSLLNLQANAESVDPQTKNAILDSQRRLKSMALIHELLYEREDFNKANLQIFTQRLLDLLQDSMSSFADINMVKNLPNESIDMPLTQMMPYGFLVTELITNVYKHAFQSAQTVKPSVQVSLSRSANLI